MALRQLRRRRIRAEPSSWYTPVAMRAYLEFEVSLRYITPRIWRRFQITANATFLDLHRAIQDSFGWQYAHLWQFQTPDEVAR